MRIQRLDNVGIVVEDLDAAIAFFTELGMELEGTTTFVLAAKLQAVVRPPSDS